MTKSQARWLHIVAALERGDTPVPPWPLKDHELKLIELYTQGLITLCLTNKGADTLQEMPRYTPVVETKGTKNE